MSYKGPGKKFMDVVRWTGNNTPRDIGGLEFSPDLVWIKSINSVYDHVLVDSVRGTPNVLSSNNTAAAYDNAGYVNGLLDDGFSVSTSVFVNGGTVNYVGWCWNAGDETVTNNDGSVTSEVRVNQDAGFSIISYNGDPANVPITVGHGMNKAPKFMIVKRRDNTGQWAVWGESFSTGFNSLTLDNTDPLQTFGSQWFNETAPDASVLYFGATGTTNDPSGEYIAYCWTDVPGYSHFGKYYGNGMTDGPIIYTGFKPRFVMIKNITTASDWVMIDTSRGTSNSIAANESDSAIGEGTGTFTLRSNGFKLVNREVNYNSDGNQYIYMAFAEQPFGKAQKKQLTFASSQDFKEILNQDVLTQYPTADAYGTVDTKDTTTNTVDVYLDGLSADFTPNANQTTTKPVTRPSSKRWTWCAWVKRSKVQVSDASYGGNGVIYQSGVDGSPDSYGTGTGRFSFSYEDLFQVQMFLDTGALTLRLVRPFSDTSTWNHIAITLDVPSGEGMKIYINGELATDIDFDSLNPSIDSSFNFPINQTGVETYLGSHPSDEYYFGGYMADVQFVDGQALLPSEFLTYSVSRENQLYPKEFGEWYGTRGYRLPMYTRGGEFDEPLANTGVADGDTWASTASLPSASWELSGTSSAFAFDGNPSTSYQLNGSVAGAGGQIYWDPPAGTIPGGSVVRIESTSYSSGTGPRFGITLDDNSAITQNANIALFFEFTVPGGRYINRVSIQAAVVSPYNVDLFKIIVDGVELTGSYQYEALVFANGTDMSALAPGVELTQEGTAVTYSNTIVPLVGTTYGGSLVFDGNLSTFANNVVGNTSNGTVMWTFPLTDYLVGKFNAASVVTFYQVPGTGVTDFTSAAVYKGSGEAVKDTLLDSADAYTSTPLNLKSTGATFSSGDWLSVTNKTGGAYNDGRCHAISYTIDGVETFIIDGTLEGPTGTVGSVTDTTVALQTSSGTWVNGENVTGSNPSYITDLHDKNQLTWEKIDIDATDLGVDTPNNYGEDNGLGGESRGNYATLNPYDIVGDGSYVTNGNLEFIASNNYGTVRSTLPISSKTYWETTVPANRIYHLTGMVPYDVKLVSDGSSRIGFSAIYGKSVSVYPANYNMWYNATTSVSFVNEISPGDIIGHTYDPATGEYKGYHNGALLGTLTVDPSQSYHPAVMDAEPSNFNLINFGSTPFAYPAPGGYKTLNTTNAEDPLILQGNTQMDVVTYTGTGAEQTISGLNFSPDLVWIKAIDNNYSNVLVDTVRGANNALFSDSTTAEYSVESVQTVSAFTSDGFTLGTETSSNGNGTSYVAWAWNAGDSTVLNTAGTTPTQVRANPLSGFSIVSYTGNGVGGVDTIGHGLGVAPSVIMIKNRDSSSENWIVYNSDLGPDDFLFLNTESPVTASTPPTYLNSTYPNSVAISLAGNAATNGSGARYVAYCWAEVPGFSRFGTVGSSADERYVATGFKPRYVMFKHTTDSTDWFIFDTERNPNNPMKLALTANNSSSQQTVNAGDNVQFFDNGFKLWNAGGYNSDYMYMAFADMPTQYLPQ